MPDLPEAGVLTEAQPTPLSRFSETLIPSYQEAGSSVVADLRASAARKGSEAVGVEQTMGEQAKAAAASRSTVEAAREKAAAQPPLDTQPRPFLMPGPGVLSQLQSAITGVTQMVLGVGGLKGGGHAIAAVAGLKGALEGWQAGDNDRAKAALRDWTAASTKLQSDLMNRLDLHRDLLTDQKTSMDNRLALIGMRAAADGDTVAADLAKHGNIKGLIEHYDKQDQALATLAMTKQRLDQGITQHEENLQERQRAHDENLAERTRAHDENLAERVQADREREAFQRENLNLRRDAADEKQIKKSASDAKHDSQVEVMQEALNQMKGLLPKMDEKKLLQQSIGPVGAGRRWLSTFMQSGDPTLAAWAQHAQTVIGFDRTIMNDLGRAQSAYAAGQAFIAHPPTREGAELVIQRFQDLLNAEKKGRSGGATSAAQKTPVLVGPDGKRYDGTGVDATRLKPGWRIE